MDTTLRRSILLTLFALVFCVAGAQLLTVPAFAQGCDDTDGDGIADENDNCPSVANKELDSNGQQFDIDGDFIGDLCDPDIDGDAIGNAVDNCRSVYNPDQLDVDRDGLGDRRLADDP